MAAVPVAQLIADAVTWRKPGNIAFATDFPEAYRTWEDAAELFCRSALPELRRMGSAMKRYMSSLLELDKTRIGTLRCQIKATSCAKAARSLAVADEKAHTRMVSECGV